MGRKKNGKMGERKRMGERKKDGTGKWGLLAKVLGWGKMNCMFL